MAVTTDKPAPYATASSILDLIERHRNRGLPSPVTAEVLARAGVSDSLVPRTLLALQTLDLIDEQGRPSETLEGIRLAPAAEYQKRLSEWLKAAYADVLSFVDPEVDDETAIRDAFRSYNPVGQQPRMVTLFLGLLAAAGMAPEKPAAQPKRSRPLPSPTVRNATRQHASRSLPPKGRSSPPQDRTPTGFPAPITGLLSGLPREGGAWTQEQRDRFITTFEAVIDFCYRIEEEEPIANHENSGEEGER